MSENVTPFGRLFRFLGGLATNAFYGRVILSFQAGKVSNIVIEQSKKIDEL